MHSRKQTKHWRPWGLLLKTSLQSASAGPPHPGKTPQRSTHALLTQQKTHQPVQDFFLAFNAKNSNKNHIFESTFNITQNCEPPWHILQDLISQLPNGCHYSPLLLRLSSEIQSTRSSYATRKTTVSKPRMSTGSLPPDHMVMDEDPGCYSCISFLTFTKLDFYTI